MNHFSCTLILLLITVGFSKAQSIVSIPGITTELNYTTIDENAGVALMGGEENYVSFDQGITWTTFDNSTGTALANVQGIDATIVNDSTYCIVVVNNNGYTYSIARTTDSGASWTLLNTQNSSIYEMGAIQSNGDNVVVAAKNGIHYSINGGATWTFVALSTGYEISNFVDYNTGSNTWFVGGYSNDVMVSTNQGATWTAVNYGFNSSEIVSSSNIGNQLLLTHEQSTGGRFLRIDSGNNLTDTIEVPQGLLFTNTPCSDANFLPNGDILASNLRRFYRIDTSNLHVYHYDFPTVIWNGVLDIALGANYGMVIRNYDSGNVGEPYRVDYSLTPNLFLPASINMFNESSTCAGDDIVCAPFAYYADSVEWYVDGVFQTSNVNLVYPTPPGVFTNYTIELIVYYNGTMESETKTVTFSSPQPPHPFTYSIDTTACYGQPFHVFIDPSSGTPQNTYIEVYYGGQLVAGPMQMSWSNMNLYTSPLYQDDTLEIIAYNSGACDNTSDTITQFIDVGPNLFDFSVLSNDSAICIGVDPVVSLINTDTTFQYDFSTSATFIQYATMNFQSNGVEPDTMSVTAIGTLASQNYSTYTNTYVPMYMYVSVQVSDTMGCVDTEVIDTFRIYRSAASFDLHSRSYYQNDTVGLSNVFVTDNRTWFSDEFPNGYIMNSTDPTPLIVSDTTGFFDIQLKNEPLPGCVDSTERIIHYAEPAVLMDTACATEFLYQGGTIHKIEYDQFGNVYEIGSSCHPQNSVPLYILRKYDQLGVFQWEKKAVFQGWGWGDITGIVIEAMDFDYEGNPIIGMWIRGDDDFTNDYFDFQPVWGNQETWTYIAKVDKNTGDIIWKTRLNDYLTTDYHWKITDLVIGNGRIHVSTFKQLALEFSTFDMDGNFISSEPFTFGNTGGTQNTFIRPTFHCGSGAGSGPQQSYWSPQLEVLSTGEVVAIGHYSADGVPLGSYTQLALPPLLSGMFVMKYTPEDGIYDVDQISTTSNHREVPHFVIDQNDNIVVSTHWTHNPQFTQMLVMDSVMDLTAGSVVFSMDANYNLNWLTVGSHSKVEDLEIIQSTGEILLLAKTKDNMSFGNGTNHMMIGNTIDTTLTYTSYSNSSNYWLNYGQTDLFLTRFDQSGSPVQMKKYDDLALSTTISYFGFRNPRLGATPCGDFAVVADGASAAGYEVDGQVYPPDSARIFFYYSNCTTDDCSFANLPDTLEQCSANTLVQVQLWDYFNLDSIVYNVLENNIVVAANQTASVNEGLFSVPTSNLGDTITLAMSYPNIDTMMIIYSLASIPNYVFSDTICFSDSMLITATPTSHTYTWSGGSQTGDTFLFDASLFSLGLNQVDVYIQSGQTCSFMDTLLVEIIPSPSNLVFNFPDTICEGDLLNVSAIPTNYDYQWLGNQYSGTNVQIAASDYNLGTNLIDVFVSNLSGCSVHDTVSIEVLDCASLEEITDSGLLLTPNPNTGVFELRFSEMQDFFTLNLFDLSGRLVYANRYESTDRVPVVVDLEPGQYTVVVQVSGREYSRKLIIM